ncbi:MAG: NUDIX hydrolase [Candidatus Woesearchaeota archaeon]
MKRPDVPEHAEKVFSGVLFDVYQWDQELYDGSTARFEKALRNDSVLVLAVAGEDVVVTREQHPGGAPFYSLVCGFLEDDEKPLVTAKRELREEAGLEASSWELYKSFSYGSKVDWTGHLFLAKGCKEVGEQQLDAGEKVDVFRVSFDEFLELTLREDFRNKEVALELARMRLRDGEIEEFKKRLFSS